MLRQIISYQRFLFEANFKSINSGIRFKILPVFFISLLFGLVSGSDYFDLLILFISQAVLYHTYVNILDQHSMPASSDRYAVFNAFLFAFVLAVIFRLFFSLSFLVIGIGFWLISTIISNVFGLSGKGTETDSLIPILQSGWQPVVLTGLFIIIVLFISTAIALIPKRKARKAALAAYLMIVSLLLRLMYAQIPDYNYSCTLTLLPDLLVDDYSKLQHANQILLAMGLACLVILPASFYAGLRFYRQRMKQGVN